MAGKRADPLKRLVDAALALAAERPWATVSLADITARAGLNLSAVHAHAPSKSHLVRAWLREVDGAVLAGSSPSPKDSVRDRLFEVLMRRVDALRPHKQAVASILHGLTADPVAALCGWPALLRSMSWMLEAASLDASGVRGALRARGLALVWLATLRAFLADESEDLGSTMAALDKALKRAEPFGRLLDGAGRPPSQEAA
jgi:AcrR family transcriptional regulator